MNKNSFCRLCADNNSETNLISINDPIAINLNLAYKINQCFQLKIETSDNLSKSVCPKCCGQVIISYNFYENIYKTQEKLKAAMLETGSYNILAELDEESIKFNFDDVSESRDQIEICGKKTTKDVSSQCEPFLTTNISRHKRRKLVKTRGSKLNSIKTKSRARQCNENEENQINKNTLEAGSTFKNGWNKYPWKCGRCVSECTSLMELREHHSSVHNQPPIYVCSDCNKEPYSVYQGFLAHVRFHRPYLNLSCDLCGMFFSHIKLMQTHRLTHESILKPYVCQKCSKGFRTKTLLYRHSKSHLPKDDKNGFVCDVCQKKYSNKTNLIVHKRLHTGTKDYTCDQCGKSFIQKGNLDHHMKLHTTLRPYSCDKCPKSFKTTTRLKNHKTIHSGVKPYECNICNRRFREKCTLKEHYRIHTGVRPFTCEYCGKSFRFRGILTIHRRQHTGEKPYSCLQCQHHFTNWPNYNKHMKRKHNINTRDLGQKQVVPSLNKNLQSPIIVSVENPLNFTEVFPTTIVSNSTDNNFIQTNQFTATTIPTVVSNTILPQLYLVQNNTDIMQKSPKLDTTQSPSYIINSLDTNVLNASGINISNQMPTSLYSGASVLPSSNDKATIINNTLSPTTNYFTSNILNFNNFQTMDASQLLTTSPRFI